MRVQYKALLTAWRNIQSLKEACSSWQGLPVQYFHLQSISVRETRAFSLEPLLRWVIREQCGCAYFKCLNRMKSVMSFLFLKCWYPQRDVNLIFWHIEINSYNGHLHMSISCPGTFLEYSEYYLNNIGSHSKVAYKNQLVCSYDFMLSTVRWQHPQKMIFPLQLIVYLFIYF